MERTIELSATIPAGMDDVWNAWLDRDAIITFFAPDCSVEPRVGGKYEIYFDPEAEPGFRGSEGMIIMALQPGQMLSFTWNNPPHLTTIRTHMTHVVIRFKEVNQEKTEISLYHDGWGCGDEWDQAYQYFKHAWGAVVVPRLKYRFETGPVDWNSPPGPVE